MSNTPEMPVAVEEVFSSWSNETLPSAHKLRELIFEVARNTEGVGSLTETLKWCEPAYVTNESGSGSTIRLACNKKAPGTVSLFFICNTSLVEDFRSVFYDDLNFISNREIRLDPTQELPVEPLTHCLKMALTYKLSRKP